MHPFFVATQAHPEFKSRPDRPHPLFAAFVLAARAAGRGSHAAPAARRRAGRRRVTAPVAEPAGERRSGSSARRSWREPGSSTITEEQHRRARTASEFTRVVVRHPGAVVVVPVDGDDVLLVRQFRAAVGDELLEVPAGKRDVDGEPPEETARRELEEEIGHRPGRLVKLAEFYNTPGFSDEYTHLFARARSRGPRRQPTRSGPEERAMTMERVPFAAGRRADRVR